jgi:peptide/nickel transport system substrate-binding protein
MIRTTRRGIMVGGASAAALSTLPWGRAFGQGKKILKVVPHADLRVLDPIWTTANVSAYHGAMVYDTLFGIDANLEPKPQMVDTYNLSGDKLTYSFTLRDGLKWHDGSPVMAKDCVASIKRWAARDGAGQHMMIRVKEIVATGAKTFEIRLKEPYGLVIDAMAKTSTPICYMMREQEAMTDPNEQVKTIIGSGPFKFLPNEWVPGSKVVYERNPDYVPRKEPPSGMAGGKVVKIDRVEWLVMDAQTSMAAIMAGEIDIYETPPLDLVPQLQTAPGVKVEVTNKLGNVGLMRLNYLHPPFNNVKARQAVLAAVNQETFMRAMVGNPQYFRSCGTLFTCGSAMDVDTDAAKGTKPNLDLAKQLVKESGYDGKPVIILQPTDIPVLNNAALMAAQTLRSIGFNVELAASDWGGVVTRRAVKKPVAEGGWNIFITWGSGEGFDNPIGFVAHTANGDAGWFGWPKDELHEKLRDDWALAATLDERKAVARKLQENAWNYVPMALLGQWAPPVGYRANVGGFIPLPAHVPFWNVEKSA